MLRLLKQSLVAALIVTMPGVALAAETLKLRPALTISVDENEKQLNGPDGVACNDKSVVVADTGNGRLVQYSFQEKVLRGGTEIRVPQLQYPIEVQYTPAGGVMALDGKLKKIAQFSAAGAFTSYFAADGVPAPSSYTVRSFKVDAAGKVYLLDIEGSRVIVTEPTGKFVSQIAVPKVKGSFSDIAVKPSGDILLLDSVGGTIYVAKKSPTGYAEFAPFTKDLGKVLNFATYLTTDSRGVAYVVDHNGAAIVSLSQDGGFLGRQLSLGWKSGTLFYPGQICLTPTGEIFVADRGNSIVQAFEILK
jgi:hypothetical protein